ncbi:hypothetical protein GCM10023149_14210 [Mucilaginibacter gynuensis]|uniref:eCIS core domain-containing protein n=1 Tax=Mucilaginibacter gynuensis TaxID=1302236 RepID=A0ABP8G3Z2_9SPHI
MHENATLAKTPQSTPAAVANQVVPVQEQAEQEPNLMQLLPVQLKLAVGAPDDPLEQEADSMADKVMRMPDTKFVHRKSPGSGYAEDEVQLKPLGGSKVPFISTQSYRVTAIQPKLSVGAQDSPLERKADSMADRVMQMPAASFIYRKATDGALYDDEHVRLKPSANILMPFIRTKNEDDEVNDSVAARIQTNRGKGMPLSGGIKEFMESRFGVDFGEVSIHTGDEAARLNAALNARAFAVGNDIYFNAGEYRPDTDEGKHLLAHELTHVIQTSKASLNKINDQVSSVNGDDKILKDPDPKLATADDEQLLSLALGMLKAHPRGTQRSGAISILVALALKQGVAQQRAAQLIKQMLAGVPDKNIDDHSAAVEELQHWVAKNIEGYDLLLYGRLWYADHGKNEIGSSKVIGPFRTWLHYNQGKFAIDYLRRKATGADKLQANIAGRIVVDLLELENDPESQKYKPNYAALRQMAQANGLESFGSIGMASATPIIFSALSAMRQQMEVLLRMVKLGPLGDQWSDADQKLLTDKINSLSVKGMQVSSGRISFSAENREETEHYILTISADANVNWLLDMAQAFTIAADTGGRLQNHTELLHQNAEALDKLMGAKNMEQSDERLALFDLRHEYITEWLSILGETFKGNVGELAENYQARIDMIDRKVEHFDEVIAKRKFKTAREHYGKYSGMWNDGNNAYPGNDKLQEAFFFTMRRVLQWEKDTLSQRFATGFSGTMGGKRVSMAPSDDYITTDLHVATALETDTNIFGMQSALFLVYASNLNLHNTMIKSDIGSADFRAEQGKRLTDMRAELEGLWNKNDFETFLKRTDAYQKTMESVAEDIKDRAKIDFLINLAITLVAALVTEGAALAVRLASLSEMLALARTARAISSMSTLFEIGVFTSAELTMQHMAFGKEIGASEVVKSVATNLAFMGVLKGVGKLAEPLAKGSPIRQLMFGHLITFTGVASISATATRIETGHWPPDIALFLAQTATTYLLIAGMHHAFQRMVAKPAISNAAKTRLENLNASNEALEVQLREKVLFGELSRADFEVMRTERLRLIEEARLVGEVLKDGGVISAAEMKSINAVAESAKLDAQNATFPINGPSGGKTVLALPAPDSVIELTRVGDTDTYVYDPNKPHTGVDNMLARYKEKGFKTEGNNALTRVIDPVGRTRFLLTSAPQKNTRLLLPAGIGSDAPVKSALERATNISEAQLPALRAQLAKINREIEVKLPADGYADHTILATISMLVEQMSILTPNWPIDGVRGLADAMALERGISRRAIRALFKAVPTNAIADLFANYHVIVTSPKVKNGSEFLIAEDLRPGNSVKLIDAWMKIREKGYELPEDMDMRAVRGVLRQIDKMPGGWLQWLSNIAKEKRGDSLRSVSGLTDPSVTMPKNVTELLANLSADIAGHPGLNPLAGANGEAFVKQLEAVPGAGKFAEARLRQGFVIKVDNLRLQVAMLVQSPALLHGKWELLLGDANEVRQTTDVLLKGGKILTADGYIGPKAPLPNVSLIAFNLPGGGNVLNAPASMDVHIDLLYTEGDGSLSAMETTTAELGLPAAWSSLDPESPNYKNTDIDWKAVDSNISSHRKFMQAVKIYQLNKMATALGTAWSGQQVNPANMYMRAGDFSAPAARALESLGFKLQNLQGKTETAAQVVARKRNVKQDAKTAAFQLKIAYKPNQFGVDKISYKPGAESVAEIRRYYSKEIITGPDKDGVIVVQMSDGSKLTFYPENKEATFTKTLIERPATKLDPKTPHSISIQWSNIGSIPGIKIQRGPTAPIVTAKDFWNETGDKMYDIVKDGYYMKYNANDGRLLIGDVQKGEVLGFYLDDARNFPNPPYGEVLIKDPMKDMPMAIDKLRVYHGLTGKNAPLTGKFSSGAVIVGDPNKTTTIVGAFVVVDGKVTYTDMPQLFDNFGNLKNADFGAKKGGFNVLNVGEGFYEPGTFFDKYNRPWLLEAIKRDDIFYSASDPKRDIFIFQRDSNGDWIEVPDPVTGLPVRKRTGFGKEVQILEQNGYKYDVATKTFKK